MIEDLFDKAQKNLNEIKILCPKGAKSLQVVFDRFKEQICSKKIRGEKDSFENIRRVIDKTIEECPESKKYAEEIRDILDTGETVKCGPN